MVLYIKRGFKAPPLSHCCSFLTVNVTLISLSLHFLFQGTIRGHFEYFIPNTTNHAQDLIHAPICTFPLDKVTILCNDYIGKLCSCRCIIASCFCTGICSRRNKIGSREFTCWVVPFIESPLIIDIVHHGRRLPLVPPRLFFNLGLLFLPSGQLLNLVQQIP